MDYSTTVKEIMNVDLTTVTPEIALKDFKGKFKARKFHHLPVETEDGELLGIISTEDIHKIQKVLPLESVLNASHIMTGNPVKVDPETSVVEAGKIFLENNFRSLPVVDSDGILVGLITPYDILDALIKTYKDDEEIADMEDLV